MITINDFIVTFHSRMNFYNGLQFLRQKATLLQLVDEWRKYLKNKLFQQFEYYILCINEDV